MDVQELANPGQREAVLSKAGLVLKILGSAGYDVINVGEGELSLGIKVLKDGIKKPTELLSSNILYADKKEHVFKPFYLAKIAGYRFIFLGVIPERPSGYLEEIVKRDKLKIDSPKNALEAVLDAQKNNFDFAIVLSSLGHNESMALSEALPKVDIIIGSKNFSSTPDLKAKAPLITNPLLGKFLRDVSFQINGKKLPFRDTAAVSKLRKRIQSIDLRMGQIKKGRWDEHTKRAFLEQLSRQKENMQKELSTLQAANKGNGYNVLKEEMIPLDSGINDDKNVRTMIEDFQKSKIKKP